MFLLPMDNINTWKYLYKFYMEQLRDIYGFVSSCKKKKLKLKINV